MAIITKNTNPKNDSHWARHRSIWKGETNVLDSVLTKLRDQQGVGVVRYKRFHQAPVAVREMWAAALGERLPGFKAQNFIGTSGVETWLGAGTPFTNDVRVIWADFVKIFAKRSNDGTQRFIPVSTTKELLFISRTNQHFDLIYSKWGVAPDRGKHWFFHWTSEVAQQHVNRAGIDVGNDDEDDESSESD